MTPDRWSRLKQIFEAAVEQPTGEREAFLAAACRDDADMLEQARRLLASHDEAASFLSPPPSGVLDAASSAPIFAPGDLVATRFRIVRYIASGGMGQVYEAQDLSLSTRVALKTIHPRLSVAGTLDLLKQEILAARRVTHPNVCRVHDIAEHTGQDGVQTTVVTMELLDGPTLSQQVRDHGPYHHKEALPLIRQICAGLDAAHDAGVIHRDFKSGNVILAPGTQGCRPVITDFGMAVVLGAEGGAHTHAGTPGYMAPEQLAGGDVTPAADVYALGVMIERTSAPQTGAWDRVTKRCTAAEPAKRYQRAADVARALTRIETRWSRRALRAAALVLAAVAGVAMMTRRAPSEPQYVLVTALQNSTDEPLLDGSVPYIFEREIGQSKNMRVASPERLQDALRLMRKKVNRTYIDPSLAADVCQRMGIPMYVELLARSQMASQLNPAKGLAFTASFIDATSHRSVRTVFEGASSLDGVPAAVQRLARHLAGEPVAGDTALLKVTTPSLRALQLFTQAYWEGMHNNYHGSEVLLRSALAEDPQFATAHLWLAWELHNQELQRLWRVASVSGYRAAVATPYFGLPEIEHEAKQAVALSNSATEHERQFILASESMLSAAYQDALPAWQRFVAAYPDDFYGLNNLNGTLNYMDRASEIDCYFLVRQRGNNPTSLLRAFREAVRRNDLAKARRYRDDYLRLGPMRPITETVNDMVDFPLQELWLAGKLDELRAQLDQLAPKDPVEADRAAILAINYYLTLGRFGEAQKGIAKLSPREQKTFTVLLAYQRDDPAALQAALAHFDLDVYSRRDIMNFWQIVPLLLPVAEDHAAVDDAVYNARRIEAGSGSLSLNPDEFHRCGYPLPLKCLERLSMTPERFVPLCAFEQRV